MITETLIIILVLILLLILIIKRFLYFRPSSVFLPANDLYQDIFQGHLHGWYKQGNTPFAILICHGNGGNISHFQPYLQAFSKMGHSVLLFDYSGYGISKGVPSEEIIYNNVVQMYQYLLQQGFPKDNIIPVGISLGGPIAAYLASRYNLPRLILLSSLPSIKILIENRLPKLKYLAFMFPEFDTTQYLANYNGKTLFVHSQEDEIIPYDITYTIQAHCTTVIPITGSHNDTSFLPWNHIEVWLINTYNNK